MYVVYHLVIISFLVGQWLLESAYDLRIIKVLEKYMEKATLFKILF